MATRYYIDLSWKELATVSYFLELELKKNPHAEWIEDVLIPVILPVVRQKNKKISEAPITFWVHARRLLGRSQKRSSCFRPRLSRGL